MSGLSIVIAAILLLGVLVFLVLRRRRSGEVPSLGIVLLLSEEHPLDAASVAEAFRTVTGEDFRIVPPRPDRLPVPSDLPDQENAVLGGPRSFLVQFAKTLFVVNSIPEQYSASYRTGPGLDEARASSIMRDHRAWISAEVLHLEAVSAENY